MSISFPNESTEYRALRNQLLKAEDELRSKVEAVSALRRRLPMGGKINEDYEFKTIDNDSVKLSKLFHGDKDTLLLYSYMFGPKNATPCPACTSLIDALQGTAIHLTQAVNFAVVMSGSIDQARQIKQDRGWSNINLLSCADNDYNRHYFGETTDSMQMPMLNVFHQRDGEIFHFWGSELLYAASDGHPRHLDQLWPLWNALDLTPHGRVDNLPRLDYSS